jgi:hypothetical protein
MRKKAMKYTVINENEKHEKNILPQGEYFFEIARAEELISKNNNVMLKLTYMIEVDDERYWLCDYLSEKIPWKIKHFMYALNMSENYEFGEITPEDCLGKRGKFKIVQEYSEKFGVQAVVSQYIKYKEIQ